MHAVFTGQLVNSTSLALMTQWHELTQEFGAGYYAYGLGLIGLWNDGDPGGSNFCGFQSLGHEGADYGSGSDIAGWFDDLGLGVSLAFTSADLFGGYRSGMNCSIAYVSQPLAVTQAVIALMNEVIEYAGRGQGKCGGTDWLTETLPPQQCQDQPALGSFLTASGKWQQYTCEQYFRAAFYVPTASLCSWLAQPYSSLVAYYKAQNIGFKAPPKVPPFVYVSDMCRATCEAANAGACWRNGPFSTWCGLTGYPLGCMPADAPGFGTCSVGPPDGIDEPKCPPPRHANCTTPRRTSSTTPLPHTSPWPLTTPRRTISTTPSPHTTPIRSGAVVAYVLVAIACLALLVGTGYWLLRPRKKPSYQVVQNATFEAEDSRW